MEPTDSSEPSDNEEDSNTLTITLSIIFGIIGLALIIFLIWYFFIRKKQKDDEMNLDSEIIENRINDSKI